MNEERLQRLSHFVEETRDQISEIESSLNGIEDVIEAEKSHSEATKQDARDQLAVGDTKEVVIEKPPNVDGPDAVTRIDGIITFVSPQDLTLTTGDTVKVKLVNVGESHTNAVATEVLSG